MKCTECGYVYNGVEDISNCPKCGHSYNGESGGLSNKSKAAVAIGAAAGAVAGIASLASQNGGVDALVKNNKIDKNSANYGDESLIVDDANNSGNDSSNGNSSDNLNSSVGNSAGEKSDSSDGSFDTGGGTNFPNDGFDSEDYFGEGQGTPSADTNYADNDINQSDDNTSNDKGKTDGDTSSDEDKTDGDTSSDEGKTDGDTSSDEDKTDGDTSSDEGKTDGDTSSDEDKTDGDTSSDEDKTDGDTSSDEDKTDGDTSGDEDNNEQQPEEQPKQSAPRRPNENGMMEGWATQLAEYDENGNPVPNPYEGGEMFISLVALETAIGMFGDGDAIISAESSYSEIYPENSEHKDVASLVSSVLSQYESFSRPKTGSKESFPSADINSLLKNVFNFDANNTFNLGGGSQGGFVTDLKARLVNLRSTLSDNFGTNGRSWDVEVGLEFNQNMLDSEGKVNTAYLDKFTELGFDISTVNETILGQVGDYFQDEYEEIKAGTLDIADSYLFNLMGGDQTLTRQAVMDQYASFADNLSVMMVMLSNVEGDKTYLDMAKGNIDGQSFEQFVHGNVSDGMYCYVGGQLDGEGKLPSQIQLEQFVFYTYLQKEDRTEVEQQTLNSIATYCNTYSFFKGYDISPDDYVYQMIQTAVQYEGFVQEDVYDSEGNIVIYQGTYRSETDREEGDVTVPGRTDFGNKVCYIYGRIVDAHSAEDRIERNVFEESFWLNRELYDRATPGFNDANAIVTAISTEEGFKDGIYEEYNVPDFNSITDKELIDQIITMSTNDAGENTIFEMEVTYPRRGDPVYSVKLDENGNPIFKEGMNADDYAAVYLMAQSQLATNYYTGILDRMQTFSYLSDDFNKNYYGSRPIDSDGDGHFEYYDTDITANELYLKLANGEISGEDLTRAGKIQVYDTPYEWEGGAFANDLDYYLSNDEMISLSDSILKNKEFNLKLDIMYENSFKNSCVVEAQTAKTDSTKAWWEGVLELLAASQMMQSASDMALYSAISGDTTAMDSMYSMANDMYSDAYDSFEESETYKNRSLLYNDMQVMSTERLNELNSEWLSIVPKFSNFGELSMKYSIPGIEIDGKFGALTSEDKDMIRDYVENELMKTDEGKAQVEAMKDAGTYDKYLEEAIDTQEALIILQQMAEGKHVDLTTCSPMVKNLVESFGYIGDINGPLEKNLAIAALQYTINTDGMADFVSKMNNLGNMGMNLEAQRRADLILQNFTENCYEAVAGALKEQGWLTEGVDNVLKALSIAPGIVEYAVESVLLPAYWGIKGFEEGLLNAVLSIPELCGVDLKTLDGPFAIFIDNYGTPNMRDLVFSNMLAGVREQGPGGQATSYVMQASQSIGNMAIPMIVSAIPLPGFRALGTALMGISAYGNSFEQCVMDGMAKGTAFFYSAIGAIAECALERFLGAMPGIGQLSSGVGKGLVKTVTAFAADALSEANEEMLQEVLDPLFLEVSKTLSLGVEELFGLFNINVNASDGDLGVLNIFVDEDYMARMASEFDMKAVLEAGIVAMISSGLSKVGVAGASTLSQTNAGTALNLSLIKAASLAQAGVPTAEITRIIYADVAAVMKSDVDINTLAAQIKSTEGFEQQFNDWKNSQGKGNLMSEFTIDNYAMMLAIEQTTNTASTIQAKIDGYNVKLDSLNQELSKQQAQLEQMKNDDSVSQKAIDKQQAKVDETLAKIEDCNTEIQRLDGQLDSLNNNVQSTVDANNKTITELNQLIEQANQAMQDPNISETDLAQLETTVKDANSTIQKLQEQNMQEIGRLQYTPDAAESRVQTLTDRLNKLNNQSLVLNENKHAEKIANVEKALNDAKVTLGESLARAKDSIIRDINTVNETIDNSTVSTPNLENLRNGLQEQVGIIDERINALRSEGVDVRDPNTILINKDVTTNVGVKDGIVQYVSTIGMVVAPGASTVGDLVSGIKQYIGTLQEQLRNGNTDGNMDTDAGVDTGNTRTRADIEQEIKHNQEIENGILEVMGEYNLDSNSPLKQFLDQMNEEIQRYEMSKFDQESAIRDFEMNISTNIQDVTAAHLVSEINKLINGVNGINHNSKAFNVKLTQLVQDINIGFETLIGKVDFGKSFEGITNLLNKLKLSQEQRLALEEKFNNIKTSFSGLIDKIKNVDFSTHPEILNQVKVEFNKLGEMLKSLKESFTEQIRNYRDSQNKVIEDIHNSVLDANYEVIETVSVVSKLVDFVNQQIANIHETLATINDLYKLDGVDNNFAKLLNAFRINIDFNKIINDFKSSKFGFDVFKDKLNRFGQEFMSFIETYYSMDSEIFQSVDVATDTKAGEGPGIVSLFTGSIISSVETAFKALSESISKLFVEADAKKFEFITSLNNIKTKLQGLIANLSINFDSQSIMEVKTSFDTMIKNLVEHINSLKNGVTVRDMNGNIAIDTNVDTDVDVVIDPGDINVDIEVKDSGDISNGDIDIDVKETGDVIDNGVSDGVISETTIDVESNLRDLIANMDGFDATVRVAVEIDNLVQTNPDVVDRILNDSSIPVDVKVAVIAKCQHSTVVEICQQLIDFDVKQSFFKHTLAEYLSGRGGGNIGFYTLLYESGTGIIDYIKRIYSNQSDVLDILRNISEGNPYFAGNVEINDYLDPITSAIGHCGEILFDHFGVDLVHTIDLGGVPVKVFITNSINTNRVNEMVSEFMTNINDPSIPAVLRNCLQNVTIHDARNPLDNYWAIKYNAKQINVEFYSAATGGFGHLNIWNNSGAPLFTLSHELGHSFDSKFYQLFTGTTGNGFFSSMDNSPWLQAIAEDGNSVSTYGDNAPSEDFAESMRLFVTERAYFEATHAKRAELLKSLLKEMTVRELGLENVTDITDLRDIMVRNGVLSTDIDAWFNDGYTFDQIKEAFVQSFALGDNINTVLSTLRSPIDTVINALNNNNLNAVIHIINSDMSVVEQLVTSGNFSFLSNPNVSADAIRYTLNYAFNNNLVSGIYGQNINIGTDVSLAIDVMQYGLTVSYDQSIVNELYSAIVNDILLSTNVTFSSVTAAKTMLNNMGYGDSLINVSDINTATRLLNYGFSNINPSNDIISQFIQVAKNSLAYYGEPFATSLISRFGSNTEVIKTLFNENTSYSTMKILMKSLSQFNVEYIAHIIETIDVSAVPNVFSTLIDGIYGYKNDPARFYTYTSADTKTAMFLDPSTASLKFDVFKKLLFEKLYDSIGAVAEGSPLIEQFRQYYPKSTANLTTQQIYIALADSWYRAEMSLFNQDYGLKPGEIINIDGVKVKSFANGKISPTMIKMMFKFKTAFGELPLVFKNCVTSVGLHDGYAPDYLRETIEASGTEPKWVTNAYRTYNSRFLDFFRGNVSKHTLIHEIGHIFDAEYTQLKNGVNADAITHQAFSDQYQTWRDMIEADALLAHNAGSDNKYVSKYAYRSAEVTKVGVKEDFCDFIADFLIDPAAMMAKYPNRSKQVVEMMYEFTSLKYNTNSITDINGLKNLLEVFGQKTTAIDSLIKKGYSFEQVKAAVVEHITFGTNIDPTAQTMRDRINAMNLSSGNTDTVTSGATEPLTDTYRTNNHEFNAIKSQLDTGDYSILKTANLSTPAMKEALLYIYQYGDINLVNDIGLQISDKTLVNGLLNMGVYNFNVTSNILDFATSSFASMLERLSSSNGAQVIETLLMNDNIVITQLFNSKMWSTEQICRVLQKCSKSTVSTISKNYLSFENKIELFETLNAHQISDLFGIKKTDSDYRNAKVFYYQTMRNFANEVIGKFKLADVIPFIPNSIATKLKSFNPNYRNMSDNDIIKVYTEAKSVAEYALIEMGVGMITSPIDYNGIEVRFFAKSSDAFNKLNRKFETFKKLASQLPKTFMSSLDQFNLLDMNDPDDDTYSIDTNGSINNRFTAAGAGGNGVFYLWNSNLNMDLMAHEIAHSFDTDYAFYKYGSSARFFTEISNIWGNAVKLDGNSVTKYGDTSLSEDFAEAVAHYFTNKEAFTRKHPNRAKTFETMLRELTTMKFELDQISTLNEMTSKMLELGVPRAQIMDLINQGYTLEQLNQALVEHLSFGVDMYDALDIIGAKPVVSGQSINSSVNGNSVFKNSFFSDRNTNVVSQTVQNINQQIATNGFASITIRNAADISVAELRQISDLSKVQFFVSSIFSDLNGNIKPKYNNPRYIARHTYTGVELLSINAKLDQLQSRIDMSLPIRERARQIYELIASEYSYMRGYNESNDTYLVSQSLRGLTANNIVGRQGLICAGYASVFKELCTRCGIQADYVRGDVITDRLTGAKGRHAWNVVIDEAGNVIPVDCCWRSGGGRDYFGKSDMFADGRIADSDEIYRDYSPEIKVAHDSNSLLDIAVSAMDAKYGPGAGIRALNRYLSTGDINSMTSSGGARDILRGMTTAEIQLYLDSHSVVDLSIYNKDIRNIYESMAIRHRSYETATRQLVEYIRTGNIYLITSSNGARDAIQRIPLDALRQFVNTRLSTPVQPSQSQVVMPSVDTSSSDALNNFFHNAVSEYRTNTGQINIDNVESSGVALIERNPARAINGMSEKNWVLGVDGEFLFKKTNDNTFENYGEILGYEYAKFMGIDCARYDFGTMDGKTGVISYSIINPGEELISGKEISDVVSQFYVKPSKDAINSYTRIVSSDLSTVDSKRYAIEDLIDVVNRTYISNTEFGLYVRSINLNDINEVNLDDILDKFKTYFTDLSTELDGFGGITDPSNIGTLIDKYCDILKYSFDDKQTIIKDIAKMIIYDSILLPDYRSIDDWSILLDRTTNSIRFAPIYDNSSMCGLNQSKDVIAQNADDGVVDVISDDRLDILRSLISKSSPETISVLRDICNKFNIDSIDRVIYSTENQYRTIIPIEVKVIVENTIVANMERINQLFNEVDNSSPLPPIDIIEKSESIQVSDDSLVSSAVNSKKETRINRISDYFINKKGGFDIGKLKGRIRNVSVEIKTALENVTSIESLKDSLRTLSEEQVKIFYDLIVPKFKTFDSSMQEKLSFIYFEDYDTYVKINEFLTKLKDRTSNKNISNYINGFIDSIISNVDVFISQCDIFNQIITSAEDFHVDDSKLKLINDIILGFEDGSSIFLTSEIRTKFDTLKLGDIIKSNDDIEIKKSIIRTFILGTLDGKSDLNIYSDIMNLVAGTNPVVNEITSKLGVESISLLHEEIIYYIESGKYSANFDRNVLFSNNIDKQAVIDFVNNCRSAEIREVVSKSNLFNGRSDITLLINDYLSKRNKVNIFNLSNQSYQKNVLIELLVCEFGLKHSLSRDIIENIIKLPDNERYSNIKTKFIELVSNSAFDTLDKTMELAYSQCYDELIELKKEQIKDRLNTYAIVNDSIIDSLVDYVTPYTSDAVIDELIINFMIKNGNIDLVRSMINDVIAGHLGVKSVNISVDLSNVESFNECLDLYLRYDFIIDESGKTLNDYISNYDGADAFGAKKDALTHLREAQLKIVNKLKSVYVKNNPQYEHLILKATNDIFEHLLMFKSESGANGGGHMSTSLIYPYGIDSNDGLSGILHIKNVIDENGKNVDLSSLGYTKTFWPKEFSIYRILDIGLHTYYSISDVDMNGVRALNGTISNFSYNQELTYIPGYKVNSIVQNSEFGSFVTIYLEQITDNGGVNDKKLLDN